MTRIYPLKLQKTPRLLARVAICPVLLTALASPPLAQAQAPRSSPSVAAAPAMAAKSSPMACDDGLKAAFKPDDLTRVLLVHQFRKGEAMELPGRKSNDPSASFNAPTAKDPAPYDICVVKLLVGPGNPGPAGAPSTSKGIHMEIWLPDVSAWNNRIIVTGSGGWSGLPWFSSMTELSFNPRSYAGQGWVQASSDDGHVGSTKVEPGMPAPYYTDASFAFNPDGTPNTALLKDFASRSLHETAIKTKALVKLYYGRPAARSYFVGGSNGGRQGLKSAQAHPEDFDGILVSNPAFNWSRLGTYTMYPQIVIQRDLNGVPPTPAQLNLVSAAAVTACDTDLNGEHAGYIHDYSACRYDPTKDRSVLCVSDGGANRTSACVTRKIALAVNKIWYGMTEDGSVPDPAVSNGYGAKLDTKNKQLWFGIPRGSKLSGPSNPGAAVADTLADGSPNPFIIGAVQLALEMQNPRLGTPNLKNASGNGADGWKSLGYADLTYAFRQGIELQPLLGGIDSNDPHLQRFRDLNRKMILTVGIADQVIPSAGALHYYERVVEETAPLAEVQSFFRMYTFAGGGHGEIGSANGLPGISPPADPPEPNSTAILSTLIDWVESAKAPDNIVISTAKGTITRPLCMYPTKLTYKGGNVDKAESYVCR